MLVNRPAPRKTPLRLTADLERREDSRFHTVLRVALVTRERDMGLWRVRNISNRGIMLATRVQLVPGERLTIALSDAIVVAGRVVWWTANAVASNSTRRSTAPARCMPSSRSKGSRTTARPA